MTDGRWPGDESAIGKFIRLLSLHKANSEIADSGLSPCLVYH